MPNWKVLGCRLTVFTSPDVVASTTLWRDLLGDDPEQVSIQRQLSIRTERGPWNDGVLMLQVQPLGRIDWLYDRASLGAGGEDTVGPYPDAAAPFIDFARHWAAHGMPSTHRIGLGIVLMTATENRETGYAELSNLIDGVPNPAEATDFIYQINWPRPSRVLKGQQINRLSKWSVAAARTITLGGAGISEGSFRYFLNLDLDVNTPADFAETIPADAVARLIGDLSEGAFEISQRRRNS
jgi:hypothetical protein